MKTRVILPGGSAAGGPMYSIERGLGRKWKPLAIAFACFAVISSFGSGNAVQSFTVADQFRQDLGVPTWVTGLILASLVAAVILGGIRRIGRVTSKLVPFMAALYVGSAFVVLVLHIDQVPGTLALIFASAFVCRRHLYLHAHLGRQARAVFERVRPGLGADCPRRRQNR
jgi:AGCS family alanine or glycine:cation symporter